MKTYAIEVFGHKDPTYVSESDVIKLVKAGEIGAKLVLVGRTFINPSAIQRIRRAYDVDATTLEAPDEELNQLLQGKQIKKLT